MIDNFPYSWLSAALDRARERLRKYPVDRFSAICAEKEYESAANVEWLAEPPATIAELDACEGSIGFALAPQHRAFLERSNGVTILSWREPKIVYLLGFRLLSTEEISRDVSRLRDRNDRFARESNKDDSWFWGTMTPAIDVMDGNYLAYEWDGESADGASIFFAAHDSGPETWRTCPRYASSFEAALSRLIEDLGTEASGYYF